jgi:GntR family transcriptional repressor for pyruvate dehydrogenase complex
MTNLSWPPAEAAVSGPPGSAWDRVRAVRASDEIVAQFRKAIFEGKLRPGDALGSEANLALRFNVSKGTIRDALRTLEASGAIEIRTGVKGGVRVANGDPLRFADILAMQLQMSGVGRVDVIEAQARLEAAAADMAASQATPDDIEKLRGLLLSSEQLKAAGDYRDISYEFHEAVAWASHNLTLIAILRAVQALRKEPLPEERPHVPKRAAQLFDVHHAIFDAIERHDGEEAARLMTDHLRANIDYPQQAAASENGPDF